VGEGWLRIKGEEQNGGVSTLRNIGSVVPPYEGGRPLLAERMGRIVPACRA
jgi:hypothetical protein